MKIIIRFFAQCFGLADELALSGYTYSVEEGWTHPYQPGCACARCWIAHR